MFILLLFIVSFVVADRLAKLAYFTLKNKKRLLLVEAPQFVLLLFFSSTSTSMLLCIQFVCLAHTSSLVVAAFALISAILKLVRFTFVASRECCGYAMLLQALLAFDMLCLIVTLVMYKYLRYKLAKHFGSKEFDLRLYVTFEVCSLV